MGLLHLSNLAIANLELVLEQALLQDLARIFFFEDFEFKTFFSQMNWKNFVLILKVIPSSYCGFFNLCNFFSTVLHLVLILQKYYSGFAVGKFAKCDSPVLGLK